MPDPASGGSELWDAIDPARPETLDAALTHLRCSLAEGLCPFCTETLDADTEEGRKYLICMNCRTGFPALTPDQSTVGIKLALRERVAKTLLSMRERIEDDA